VVCTVYHTVGISSMKSMVFQVLLQQVQELVQKLDQSACCPSNSKVPPLPPARRSTVEIQVTFGVPLAAHPYLRNVEPKIRTGQNAFLAHSFVAENRIISWIFILTLNFDVSPNIRLFVS